MGSNKDRSWPAVTDEVPKPTAVLPVVRANPLKDHSSGVGPRQIYDI